MLDTFVMAAADIRSAPQAGARDERGPESVASRQTVEMEKVWGPPPPPPIMVPRAVWGTEANI